VLKNSFRGSAPQKHRVRISYKRVSPTTLHVTICGACSLISKTALTYEPPQGIIRAAFLSCGKANANFSIVLVGSVCLTIPLAATQAKIADANST
jgi:hypothetical protein